MFATLPSYIISERQVEAVQPKAAANDKGSVRPSNKFAGTKIPGLAPHGLQWRLFRFSRKLNIVIIPTEAASK